MRVGGPGAGVELKEISFRARAAQTAEGRQIEWRSYFGVVGRGSREIVLRRLKKTYVRGSGQRGGHLGNEELYSAIMGEDGQKEPLLAARHRVLH